MKKTEAKLMRLLDGAYRRLRDDNHVEPHSVLVFEEEKGTVEAVDVTELPLRYPIGAGGRWSAFDLGELMKDQALLYRQSMIAHEISNEDAASEPTCGTVVLVVPEQKAAPYRRLAIKAKIEPDLN